MLARLVCPAEAEEQFYALQSVLWHRTSLNVAVLSGVVRSLMLSLTDSMYGNSLGLCYEDS